MDTNTTSTERERNTILRAKMGDLRAFEDVLSCYERQIFSYIFRLVRQREDAEDLFQVTFLKFFQSLTKLDAEKSVRAWIYTIATNVVHDWWRKQKHHPEWLNGDDDAMEVVGTIAAPDAYTQIEVRHDLDQALAELTPMHRCVLLLYYRDGLSYQEIAEALNVPINTIKTRLVRAKQSLQQKLHDSYG